MTDSLDNTINSVYDNLTQNDFMTGLNALHGLYQRDPARFRQEFVDEKPRIEKRPLIFPDSEHELSALVDIGIVEKVGAEFLLKYRVYALPLEGIQTPVFLVSDGHVVEHFDRTYSPKDAESGLIARTMPLKEKGRVLDIASGVGTHSIAGVIRERKSTALGLEINPRAIRHAYYNAALNGVRGQVEFLESDLLRALIKYEGSKDFTTIVTNAPFVPIPNGMRKYRHSDGGEYGDDISLAVLESIEQIMSENTIALMASYTLGAEDEITTRMLKKLHETFDFFRADVTYRPPAWVYKRANQTDIAKHNPIELKEFALRYEHPDVVTAYKAGEPLFTSSEYATSVRPWLQRLKGEGLTHLHYVFVALSKAKDFRLTITNPHR